MISDRKLRIALVGLGRIAWQYHLPTIRNHCRYHLCGVVDPLPERLREATETFDVAAYASLSDMLQRERPEVTVIASPTCFHAAQALEAFQAGSDVICEKPLAGNLNDAMRMAEAASRYQRKLVVYQPHRFTPAALVLRRILASGLLGDLYMVRRSWNSFSRRNDWQAFVANGGGMLNNYGSHFLDQFIALFGGDFGALRAELRRVVGGGDAEDFVKIQGRNGRGIVLDLEINMGSAFTVQDWLVYGTNGTARLEEAQDCWRVRSLDVSRLHPLKIQSGMAAVDRQYPTESDLPWREEIFPLTSVAESDFFNECYHYFVSGAASPVALENSLEVMRLLERCRQKTTPEEVMLA